MSAPVDIAVRERALSPEHSFIVQAPAGSGKTELLTRRVLRLLAVVQRPEEVLAITFTRKAASEMRERVVGLLARAARGEPPRNDYEAESDTLARRVLERDAALDWQILKDPQRLAISTIDSLCTRLAHGVPVVSTLGAASGVTEQAMHLHRQAASNYLQDNAGELDELLFKLGNRFDRAEQLLAELLSQRDLWRDTFKGTGDAALLPEIRRWLEDHLRRVLEDILQGLLATLPPSWTDTLPRQLAWQADLLRQADQLGLRSNTRYTLHEPFLTIDALPGVEVAALVHWQAIATWLLTGDMSKPAVRKRLTRNEGYPTDKDSATALGIDVATLKARKAERMALLGELEANPELVDLLHLIRQLPTDWRYSDQDWRQIAQLLSALPAINVALQWVFSQARTIDFAELAWRARQALGSEEEPTDLALALDMRLQHILVDEFQDTSQSQFALFRQLVAGWTPGDGRTFFAVGDPMQSIYRFRGAEVSLFQHAREQGVGDVRLESLVLETNFRSAAPVIGWVNDTFTRVFPAQPDADIGAVPYAPSTAFRLDEPGGVEVHPLIDGDARAEAACVAGLCAETIAADPDPDHSIAILVRNRSQAREIFRALQRQGIAYQSVEMDLLAERGVVRDLLTLCLALRYPHDRLHWLALLRAPWCGLTLTDLHTLMHDAATATVFECATNAARLASLDDAARARLARVTDILAPAVTGAARGTLVPWLSACWEKLGGPALCRDAVDHDAVVRCLERLQQLESEGRLWRHSVIVDSVKSLYAVASHSDARVQIMTMHKAKGLEFGTVIMPALGKVGGRDRPSLLDWMAVGDGQRRGLLLAPFQESGAPANGLNLMLKAQRRRCAEQETLRLLYVACTRAKTRLHLVAAIARKKDGDLSRPPAGTLLAPLWPLLREHFDTAASALPTRVPAASSDAPAEAVPLASVLASEALSSDASGAVLTRLPLDWQPHWPPAWHWPAADCETEDAAVEVPEFLWAGTAARHVGTVVHRHLQRMTRDRGSAADTPRIRRQLANLGVAPGELDKAVARVRRALSNIAGDPRAAWILDDSHAESRSEWALSAVRDGQLLRIVVDRSFIDRDGTRWLIDYKTGDHRGGDVEGFLDSEQTRYAPQLQRYADIIGVLDDRPIRLGLYFPLLKGWREFDPR